MPYIPLNPPDFRERRHPSTVPRRFAPGALPPVALHLMQNTVNELRAVLEPIVDLAGHPNQHATIDVGEHRRELILEERTKLQEAHDRLRMDPVNAVKRNLAENAPFASNGTWRGFFENKLNPAEWMLSWKGRLPEKQYEIEHMNDVAVLVEVAKNRIKRRFDALLEDPAHAEELMLLARSTVRDAQIRDHVELNGVKRAELVAHGVEQPYRATKLVDKFDVSGAVFKSERRHVETEIHNASVRRIAGTIPLKEEERIREGSLLTLSSSVNKVNDAVEAVRHEQTRWRDYEATMDVAQSFITPPGAAVRSIREVRDLLYERGEVIRVRARARGSVTDAETRESTAVERARNLMVESMEFLRLRWQAEIMRDLNTNAFGPGDPRLHLPMPPPPMVLMTPGAVVPPAHPPTTLVERMTQRLTDQSTAQANAIRGSGSMLSEARARDLAALTDARISALKGLSDFQKQPDGGKLIDLRKLNETHRVGVPRPDGSIDYDTVTPKRRRIDHADVQANAVTIRAFLQSNDAIYRNPRTAGKAVRGPQSKMKAIYRDKRALDQAILADFVEQANRSYNRAFGVDMPAHMMVRMVTPALMQAITEMDKPLHRHIEKFLASNQRY